ncbi:hypothetical protein HYDPIDRAFT_131222 [Hydnomerulius pinastri MD-312]|uniref:Uncharacterized protein n=1 Tax=Hydnomerulius pinastri MD-312 TaxID=994086 RepID=A0A0C9WFQ2_9AGAM|nr:hypothetical protein HYDPIDRAFT_131222 [Hydnomerulius pinastri MD-312]
MSQPLPPHLQQNQHQSYPQNIQSSSLNTPSPIVPSSTPTATKPSSSRPPYGSGDTDDGYTLVFPNLAAFQEWRNHEEETQMVEFVKGDTHGSKAVPPRFKDHTKLVCARHSRSGRKKYVKKHPERVRKVPSRKLEGQGCQASISYKTYFDTEEVRVCYIAEHSHPIGLANLPYTRRGRRAAVEAEKTKTKRPAQPVALSGTEGSASANNATTPVPTPQPHMPAFPPGAPLQHLPHPFPHYPGPPPGINPPYPHMVAGPQGSPAHQEQWDRMTVLFNSIREHARAYDYPGPSVVALESVLIRLYLESPMGMMGGPGLGALGANMHGIIPPQPQGQASQGHVHDAHSQTPMNGASGTGDHAGSEMDSGMESG